MSRYPHYIPVIKFGTDGRIALAVNLVPGKSADMWPRCAPVQDVLLVLNLDVHLPGLDDRPICIRPGEAIVQIGMIRLILQFSQNLKRRCCGSRTSLQAEKVSQPQVGIF